MKYISILTAITLSYLVGFLTYKFEWYPYNLYKSYKFNDIGGTFENKHQIFNPEFSSKSELLKALKKGGFILYMRHADKFENSSSNQIRSALDSFEAVTSTVHTHQSYDKGLGISEYGEIQSWILNKIIIEELGIPFKKLISSPIKRCRQTASIVFGKEPEISNFLIYDSILTDKERNYIIPKQKDLFENSFLLDGNTAIVAHGNAVLNRIGILANIEQSDTLVLQKNQDGKIVIVDWLRIEDWVKMLERNKNLLQDTATLNKDSR